MISSTANIMRESDS